MTKDEREALVELIISALPPLLSEKAKRPVADAALSAIERSKTRLVYYPERDDRPAALDELVKFDHDEGLI